MKKNMGMMVLALCLCGIVRLWAQEAVSQVIPPESKQEVSRNVPIVITASDRNPIKASYQAWGRASLKNNSRTDRALPFPVAIPQAISYPRQAIRKGWEGQTVVAAEVLPDGSVGRTALAKTSGHEVLDRAAQEAIQTWKFKTESEKEDTVPQYVDIPVTFKLEDQGN